MRPSLHSFVSALLIVTVALVATGCTNTWTGKGKVVAQAVEQSGKTKTGRLSGSLQLSMTGMPGAPAEAKQLTLVFTGKGDVRDPAHPKFEMSISGDGKPTRVVDLGDGTTYETVNGRTYSYPSPEKDAQETQSVRVLTALGASVGGFRESQPMTNLKGESVPAIYATVDKDKLCSTVVSAFGPSFTDGTEAAEWSKTLGGDGAEGLQAVCKRVVKDDPGVWFGISDGLLTDLAITANIALPMGAAMSMTVQYHEYDQDEDVGEFKIPKNVTPTASLEEARALVNQSR